jgi:23S rRNA (uracil1939-C5)-methyltransferase
VILQWNREGIKVEVIVVDPTRKGCDEELLARDLRYLKNHMYRTVKVQPVDMFPHSFHVECCVLLVRM